MLRRAAATHHRWAARTAARWSSGEGGGRLFSKILVANRGEIACRVMRTAKAMGVRTVAVYSDADRGAMHVAMADEAINVGAAPASESYLRGEVILDAARATGAQAIHPGYGFLSENAGFAEACERAGVTFIGPPASAIRDMGSKSASKDIMLKAGVACTPGYHGDDQEVKTLLAESKKIGFPVLIKAVMGGGGKGMRLVEREADFKEALDSCRREAASSFGDDRVLIEKFLVNPRHVEVQVFSDGTQGQGGTVYLFERDCSVQRRHQKVLEEAPAPSLTEEQRRRVGEAAVAAAEAVGYKGAGTVEFMMDAVTGDFYFMEMNTRLQVEHPVTELVTGQDLVEWQLKVASGQGLPVRQEDLRLSGHAIEARVYAENPANNFLPGVGHLSHLRPPLDVEGVRVDTGVREGDDVTVYYDPMIAKLIVHGPNRDVALARLHTALLQYQVCGVPTNLDFLARCASHPAFVAGGVDTGFIEKHWEKLMSGVGSAPPADVVALAALGVALRGAGDAAEAATHSYDPTSPWAIADGFGIGGATPRRVAFEVPAASTSTSAAAAAEVDVADEEDGEATVFGVDVTLGAADAVTISLPDGSSLTGTAKLDGTSLVALLNGTKYGVDVVTGGSAVTVFPRGLFESVSYELPLHAPDTAGDEEGGAAPSLVAPMAGKVVQVLVEEGQHVDAGQALVVMEAMKMEHVIRAPHAGVVSSVFFADGDLADDGATLLQMNAHDKA